MHGPSSIQPWIAVHASRVSTTTFMFQSQSCRDRRATMPLRSLVGGRLEPTSRIEPQFSQVSQRSPHERSDMRVAHEVYSTSLRSSGLRLPDSKRRPEVLRVQTSFQDTPGDGYYFVLLYEGRPLSEQAEALGLKDG